MGAHGGQVVSHGVMGARQCHVQQRGVREGGRDGAHPIRQVAVRREGIVVAVAAAAAVTASEPTAKGSCGGARVTMVIASGGLVLMSRMRCLRRSAEDEHICGDSQHPG
jgi:hypothetical protein